MRARILPAGALLATSLIIATEASAHGPAPLVPAALVEDVQSATAEVEFMDYIGAGQVIKLEPRDVLILSYLKSCEHETITGGTVVVGAEHSQVQDGKITRTRVPCDGGRMRLSYEEASASAAASFRVQGATHVPMLYARSPMIKLPRLQANDSHVLVIERTDRPGERIVIMLGENLAGGGFYDLAEAHEPLSRGATYSASIGDRKITFKIDANARSDKAPIVSRLLRFQLN